MKYIEIKYSQLLGKVLAFDTLAAISTKRTKNTDMLGVDSEKNGTKNFGFVESTKLYGTSLLVDKLLDY